MTIPEPPWRPWPFAPSPRDLPVRYWISSGPQLERTKRYYLSLRLVFFGPKEIYMIRLEIAGLMKRDLVTFSSSSIILSGWCTVDNRSSSCFFLLCRVRRKNEMLLIRKMRLLCITMRKWISFLYRAILREIHKNTGQEKFVSPHEEENKVLRLLFHAKCVLDNVGVSDRPKLHTQRFIAFLRPQRMQLYANCMEIKKIQYTQFSTTEEQKARRRGKINTLVGLSFSSRYTKSPFSLRHRFRRCVSD